MDHCLPALGRLAHWVDVPLLGRYGGEGEQFFDRGDPFFAPTSAAGLFCAEYAALAAAATLLLLLGLSAVGPVCIFLFTMLYGLGNGFLSAQLLAGADGKSILALLLLGIPAACAAGCLCMFGAAALQVSGRIRAYSFRKTAGQACSGARELMGQYLLVIVVFLPLCGAATGVAYLSGKIL